MSDSKLFYGMLNGSPNLKDKPSELLPDDTQATPNIDETELSKYLLEVFGFDVQDKEQYGWVVKREYDLKSYYMIKDLAMTRRPWPGASAYPVPITPTLLDTGWANIVASMKSPDGRMIRASGVGEEDIRKAVPLESLLNWQVTNTMDMDNEQDKNIFRALIHGRSIMKVMQDFEKNRVKVISFDAENFYIPIDADDVQSADRVHQIIPLTTNQIELRKLWGIYKDLDKMTPGARISRGQSADTRLMQMKDLITGTSKEQKSRRETYFMCESYCDYAPKSGTGYGGGPSRAGVKPIPLIVWWSPNGGTIHRVAKNEDKMKPFAEYDIYPTPGYFWSMSLPEKLKGIQEKANYADKQNTDALDVAISPAAYIDDSSEFNKNTAQRVPGGIYTIGKNNTITFEQRPPRDPGFEKQYQTMWIEAQQLTGMIDIAYGAQTKDQTLGQTQIRTFRADIRFSSIVKRIEMGWKKTIDLIYHYDNKFMDRKTKIKVIGYADYQSIDELFPNPEAGALGLGFEGKFDFEFAGAAVTDVEKDTQKKIAFYEKQLLSPDVLMDKATSWKMRKELAEAYGVRDFERVMAKPKEALALPPEEAIQRVVSGQKYVPLRPEIDADAYIYEIELFMRGETFANLAPEQQQVLGQMRMQAYVMRAGQMKALMDLQTVQAHQQSQGMAVSIADEAENRAGQENGSGKAAA